jgi:hypothetical protein
MSCPVHRIEISFYMRVKRIIGEVYVNAYAWVVQIGELPWWMDYLCIEFLAASLEAYFGQENECLCGGRT